MPNENKRDLAADLATCEAATGMLDVCDGDLTVFTHYIEDDGNPNIARFRRHDDAVFYVEARTGWPHAIERTLAAEAKVSELRFAMVSSRIRQ